MKTERGSEKKLAGRDRQDDGNATAEFVMTSALVLLLFLGVLQLAFAIYVRNIMTDAASSGARYGTLLDRTYADGVDRTSDIIDQSLPLPYAHSVQAHETVVDGAAALEITVEGDLPVVGTFGFDRGFSVSGHALIQNRSGE
ncbi:TadE/TadG family type IV pilus assembly protein [Rothia aerolata]|uniref:TadE-like domain-containing protein n=1 Tax=Rothia aerolata TaxID=1812262 RepID=A0A917MRC9_9MICC|nr:TadE/TadG family type IV pilus assembly protein [Rothia aerolata]GGH59409.1 hypothetical protein GCM10007359_06570 [Rothia aerolata]